MKFITCSVIATALMALAGCQQQTSNVAATPAPAAPTESASQPVETQTEPQQEILIDVRSKEEWDSGHLSQAVHIPHTEITERIPEVTDDKSAKLVLY